MAEEILIHGEGTKFDIIRSAHNLFIERGYHGTSMRQIAQDAGVALGGIYNHFASKDQLFMAVLLDYHPITIILPAMVDAQGDTIEAFIRDAARRLVACVDNRLDFLNLMFIEMVEFKGQHVPQLFEVIFPKAIQFAQRSLEGYPELRPIPLPILMRAFIGLFFSYFISELLISQQRLINLEDEALQYFIDIFLHGIIKEGQES